jgi:hypothetical protein
MLKALGPKKYDLFFETLYENYFTEADARYVASLGLNLIRIPINYRLFEDDMNPRVIKPEGFKHLDRVIKLCAAQGIYTIIDLHALPGYQNQHWHSDNPTHQALLWKHKDFQDRTVVLWEAIASRYRDEPWVAGYDLINEPADPTGESVVPFFRRLMEAVRIEAADARDGKVSFGPGDTRIDLGRIVAAAPTRDDEAIATSVAISVQATKSALDLQSRADADQAATTQRTNVIGSLVLTIVMIISGVLSVLLIGKFFRGLWRSRALNPTPAPPSITSLPATPSAAANSVVDAATGDIGSRFAIIEHNDDPAALADLLRSINGR